ncbi:MAG: hypothetical protein HXS46_20465 [Theionarchaea archaeon]|nr:hypothetical protein [Theionarchaea archaeon]
MDKREELLAAVFILSVGAVIWSTLFKSGDEPISYNDFVGLIPVIISLLGADQQKKKRKKRKAKSFRLTPSVESGLYGGLIGGAIAGVIIGVVYFRLFCELSMKSDYEVSWEIIPQIFVYASVAGAIWGALSQLIILWFRHLATEKQFSKVVFNEVSGGIFGGIVGGIPMGVLGTLFFGLRPLPFPPISLLVTGCVLGGICVVLGALFYEYEGRWRNVMRSLLVSAVISAFLVMLAIVIWQIQEHNIYMRYFHPLPTTYLVIEGGAVLGLAIGIILGLQIGCTLRLYRLWEGITEPIGQ